MTDEIERLRLELDCRSYRVVELSGTVRRVVEDRRRIRELLRRQYEHGPGGRYLCQCDLCHETRLALGIIKVDTRGDR